MNRNIAIIPARGGSKRLPRKNILPFMGLPVIAHSVQAAADSGLFAKIVVSTEDEEIKRLVAGGPCEIHSRPQNLATDTARVVEVLRHVLEEYKKRGEEFTSLCCLYPTAPLRNSEDIRQSHELMMSRNADYCLGVTEYPYSPFFAFDIAEGERIRRRFPDIAKLPPWKKPSVVVDNGSLYWARVAAFLKSGELEGENAVGFRMPKARSVDIDTPEDFKLAEFYAAQTAMAKS